MIDPYLKCFDLCGRVMLLNPKVIHTIYKSDGELFVTYYDEECRKYERIKTSGHFVDAFNYLAINVNSDGIKKEST